MSTTNPGKLSVRVYSRALAAEHWMTPLSRHSANGISSQRQCDTLRSRLPSSCTADVSGTRRSNESMQLKAFPVPLYLGCIINLPFLSVQPRKRRFDFRSEEHTSELQSHSFIS